MDKKKEIKMRRISLPYWNAEQRCLEQKFIDIPANLEGRALRKYVYNLLRNWSADSNERNSGISD